MYMSWCPLSRVSESETTPKYRCAEWKRRNIEEKLCIRPWRPYFRFELFFQSRRGLCRFWRSQHTVVRKRIANVN